MKKIKNKISIDIEKKISDFSDVEFDVIKKYSISELVATYNEGKIKSNYEELVKKYHTEIFDSYIDYIQSNADLFIDEYIDCHAGSLSEMEQDTGFREQKFDDDDVIEWKVDSIDTIDDIDEDFIFDWLVEKSNEIFE